MDKLKSTPTLQATIRNDGDDGAIFEIYAYWKLTGEEIEREIALFVISSPNHRKLSLRNAEKGDPATGVRFARHA